jgi:hypothetical protein
VIPHRIVEQSLRPIRSGIPTMLGDRPAVLARQITHHRRDVLPSLLKRLRPSTTGPQPPIHLSQLRDRPLTLYPDSRSRPTIFLPHNMIIARRLPS